MARRIEDKARGLVHEFEQTIIGSDDGIHCRMQRVLDGVRIGDVVHYVPPTETAEVFAAPAASFMRVLAEALVRLKLASGSYAED